MDVYWRGWFRRVVWEICILSILSWLFFLEFVFYIDIKFPVAENESLKSPVES